jgi:hypothetical protein
VADPSLGWLQDLSKWWLDVLDDRDALVQEHQRLKALVQQAEQVTRATQSP